MYWELSGLTAIALSVTVLWMSARPGLFLKLLASLVALSAGAVLVASLVHPLIFLGDNEGVAGAVMYVSMILGICAKYGADYLGGTTSRFDFRRFLLPIVVSPLVFGFVWNQLKHELSLQISLLAFQNGFFWKAIYDSLGAGRRSRNGSRKS